MKALNLHNIAELVYEDVAAPILGENEVLLKIRACGICSSDVDRVFTTGTYHFPTIPGHEFSGEIVDVAPGVDTSLIGRRATVFPLLPCNRCEACQEKVYALCSNYKYFGSRNDGAFAEYLAVPTWNLVLFKDNVPFEVAALAEPAAVAHHAVDIGNVKRGDKVAIIGTGTIGILIGAFAKLKGAEVYVCGRRKESLDFVSEFGFHTIEVSQLKNTVEAVTDGMRMDVTFEAVGSNASLEDAIMSTKIGGVVVMTGNPKGDMTMARDAYWKILRWQLTLKGTWNSNFNEEKNDWKTVLGLMEEERFPFQKLISKTYKLEEHKQAFDYLRDHTTSKAKIMFTMGK